MSFIKTYFNGTLEVTRTAVSNFINILRSAFTRSDPESVTFQLSLQYLFMLLVSSSVKADQKTLMKLTPVVHIPPGVREKS